MMKPVMVVIFSVFDIILGMASVGVQLAALILYTRISNFVDVNYDVVAHGIWCGFIYIGAGSQGLYSSYNRPQALRLTVMMAVISVCGAIVAATLSGLAAASGYSYGCNSSHYTSSCVPWLELEWVLMSISIISGLNNLTLMYFAHAARKSSKCQPRSINRHQHRNISSSDCEPPGAYSVSGHAERPQQKPSDKNDEICQADV
uniref:Uncharacterized protein n=1 Tax=Daphnia galeata TaxID=27404 RepID=A0A8J2RDK1_9CRUS|nr:unnamed protein product [Daphnia galeata]